MVDATEHVPNEDICKDLLMRLSFPETEKELVQILGQFEEL